MHSKTFENGTESWQDPYEEYSFVELDTFLEVEYDDKSINLTEESNEGILKKNFAPSDYSNDFVPASIKSSNKR